MSKLFKRTALIVLCAILVACTVAVGTILGLNSRANNLGLADGNGGKGSAAGSVTITPDNFDKEYNLDGADSDAQAAIWTEAVTYSKNNGKTVRVNLITDWIAKNTNSYKSFGVGDCFTSGSTGNTYEGSIFVPLGANIIINLNGHTIDRNCQQTSTASYGGVIWVEGTLEIRDDSFLYDSNGYDKGVIKGGLVGWGGAIGVGAGAKLTINGGTFTGNTATICGGVLQGGNNSEIVINYGYFVDNTADTIAGVVHTLGRLTINDGYFINNRQTNNSSSAGMGGGGGGLSGAGLFGIAPTATLTINGGLFDGNSTQAFGGCILAYGNGTNNSTVNINGGTFSNNEALSTNMGNAGVIYADGPATINITGGIFNNNRATFYGGVLVTFGVQNNVMPTINISGGEFFNNQATAGSVVFIMQGTLNMSGGYMHDNIATVSGMNNTCGTGAIFLFGCQVNNTAVAMGYAPAYFSGGKIVNNTGGGVYTCLKDAVFLSGGLIVEGNSQYNFFLNKQNLNTSSITSGDTYFNITGELVKDGQAAHIGISIGNNGAITDMLSAGQIAFVTQGYGNVYPNTSYPNASFICQPYQGSFFFSDGAAYSGMNNTECVFAVLTAAQSNVLRRMELTWTYKLNGVTRTADTNYVRCEYGDEITEVTASWSGTRAVTGAAASMSMTWTENGGVTTTGLEMPSSSVLLSDKNGNTFTKIDEAGSYSFIIDGGEPFFFNANNDWLFADKCVFNIEVAPKNVTVTIDDTTSVYGEAINLTSNADTVVSDLGVTLTRESNSSSVGKYKVRGSFSNPNYTVTFVNAAGVKPFGMHEITPLEVTVILNDDEAEYGKKFYTLNKDQNNNAVQAVGAITQKDDGKYYDSEDHLVDGDGVSATAYRIDANGNKIYKGGWRYGDGSSEFYANDISVAIHKYPFELSLTYNKADGTVVDITNAGNADIIPKGSYDIVAKGVNKNYDITFVISDGTENNKATFTVTGAKLKVETPTSASTYNKSTYNNADKASSISLPTSEIKGIDNAVVTTATVKYYNVIGTSATPVNPAPTTATTSGWMTSVPTGTIKNAGEYKIYCLITEPNYADLVYCMTYTVEQQELKYTLEVKQGTTVIQKTDGAYKATYSDTAVTVAQKYASEPSYLAADIAAGVGPDVAVYYKGNGANGNNYGTAADIDFPDNSGNDAQGSPLNKGNSNAPKEAGVYTASLVNKSGSSSNYKLVPDTGASDSETFEIEAKKVALPTAAIATGSTGTYNGNVQTINYQYETAAIKALTSANCTSISEVIDGVTKTYKDLTIGASNANTSTKKTTTAFTATDAGDYAVKFELTNTRNYKWDDNSNPTGAQIVKSTIKKAELDLTLVSPLTSGWQWDAGSEGNITVSAITGVINNAAVTFDVSWYKYDSSASGDPVLDTVQNGVAYGDIEFDISVFTTEATYYLVIQLADTTVNANYTLPDDDSHFNPKLEGVKLREIAVGAGQVDTTNIKWQYKLTASGNESDYLVDQTDPDDNTKLVYTAVYNTVSQVWEGKEYIVTVKANSLPSYLEIDTAYSSDGYTNGYKDNAKTDAGTYTASVRLKVKDGSSYTFADGTTSGSATFSWTIEKKELKFVDDDGNSLVKWAFSTDARSSAGGEQDPDATWTEFSDNAKPAYTDARIYVKISTSWLESLGLSADASQIEVRYNNTNFQTAAKTQRTTSFTVTLKSNNAANYAIATGENAGTFVWEIGYAQIKVTGWSGTRDVYDEVTGKSFTLPAADVPAELEGKIEYTYSYDIFDANGNVIGHKDDVDEATMIEDLYPVTDETHPNTTLKVKPVIKSGESYDIVFEAGVNEEESATIGEMKTSVTVEVIGSGSEYGSVRFEVKATYYPDNDTSLSIKDFLENRSQYLKITITGPEGNVAEMTANDLSNAFEILKNAGTYTVRFEITDADVKAEFALKKNSFEFVVAPKQITVPEITGEIVFAGKNIDLKEYLDANYAEYSDQEIVQWTSYDTDCYHVGTYNAVLTIVNANYVWAEPENADADAATKSHVRYTVVDNSIAVGSDKINATYSWEIKPFVLDGASLWNTSGKEGASLNLPEWVVALMSGENPTLGIEYAYRTDKASPAVDPEWKGGNTYFVSATLNGADAQDFVFANETQTSEMVSYTVPQSGAAAFFNNVGSFVKNNWLWFVIGGAILLFLILLIIIIAVARKKKKKKAAEEEAKKEKEEAKAAAAATAAPVLAASAAMADEKAKLEAEKAKMEAELAKAKMQAELDLQKAKMEAEMAKMRAEAEAQTKQVQQPAQQAVSQPVQQPAQQIQSNVDASVIAELKAELAALRASHATPSYSPAPYAGGDYGALAKIEAEIEAMRSEQRAIREAELKATQEVAIEKMKTEFARLRADSHYGTYSQPVISPETQNALPPADMPAIPANVVGALILSAMNMAKQQPAKPVDQPTQVIEAESQSGAVNTPTMYPPDAVITTTTTVDTTNRARESGERIESRDRLDDSLFDIDGFYDKFEGNK